MLTVVNAIRESFVVTLGSGFLECLLLALFVDAVVRGHRVYLIAAVGMSLTLIGRMSEGFISPGPDNILKIAGLVLAALVVTLDVITEEVNPNEPETAS